MATLDNLRGAELTGVWVDAPGHRVTLGLRLDRADGPTDYLLVLEAVTDFSYFDESGEPWADARVASVSARHDLESMHLDFAFAGAGAGLAISCGKAVLRKSGWPPA